jgi:RHS repeat-associated protein
MDDPATTGTSEGFGLMFYNARWYDPYLNHFTQPDTIVPDPYNSQSWDRYAYALNNPLRYTDPTGHDVDCSISDSYCNDAKREYYHSWRSNHNSSFKPFLRAKDAYDFYYNHPDIAFDDWSANNNKPLASWEDVDSYTLASIYSEDVKHQFFNPVSDQVLVWKMDKLNALRNAGEYVDPMEWAELAAMLLITFGPDGSSGGGGGGGKYLNDWANVNFNSVDDAFNYHYALHGGPWSSPEAYTQAAKKFYNANVNLAEPWMLKDGSEGLMISTRKYYGIYTMDGKIVSFGPR